MAFSSRGFPNIFQVKSSSYSGRHLYQYNEDDFLFRFLLLTSFFKISNLQVNIKILCWQTASPCFHVFFTKPMKLQEIFNKKQHRQVIALRNVFLRIRWNRLSCFSNLKKCAFSSTGIFLWFFFNDFIKGLSTQFPVVFTVSSLVDNPVLVLVFRMMLVHLGLPQWQLKFTSLGKVCNKCLTPIFL